jgi:hypothetical protein
MGAGALEEPAPEPPHGHSDRLCGSDAHSHHGDDFQNQNLRGAIVHVLGDILQSVGVAVAGAVIWCARTHACDPCIAKRRRKSTHRKPPARTLKWRLGLQVHRQ